MADANGHRAKLESERNPHISDHISKCIRSKRKCGSNTETEEVTEEGAERGEESAVSETLNERLHFPVTKYRNKRANTAIE
jgi:hypothetical protein